MRGRRPAAELSDRLADEALARDGQQVDEQVGPDQPGAHVGRVDTPARGVKGAGCFELRLLQKT